MREHIPRLLGPIKEILDAHPEGIREFDLLNELRRRGIPPLAATDNAKGPEVPGDGRRLPVDETALSLFRSHFFLFHVLYLLRNELRGRHELDLNIFCLDIRLRPWQSPEGNFPAEADPLEGYYLDWGNFEEMDAPAVKRLLSEAARRIDIWFRRDEHLSVLGLKDPVSDAEINSRYRELCLRHHPDAGGDAESFAVIQSAVEALRI
jgi:hypothetical protein